VQLLPMLGRLEVNTGRLPDVLMANAGSCSTSNREACEERGREACVSASRQGDG